MVWILVEGIIMLIIMLITFGALLYITPGTLGTIKTASPVVEISRDAALNASAARIATSIGGGVSLTGIAPILMGLGLLILGFTFIRARKQ